MLSEIDDIIAVHRAIIAALKREAQQHIIKKSLQQLAFYRGT
jgi:hypothetical protein